MNNVTDFIKITFLFFKLSFRPSPDQLQVLQKHHVLHSTNLHTSIAHRSTVLGWLLDRLSVNTSSSCFGDYNCPYHDYF